MNRCKRRQVPTTTTLIKRDCCQVWLLGLENHRLLRRWLWWLLLRPGRRRRIVGTLTRTTTNGYVPHGATFGPVPLACFAVVTRLCQAIVVVVGELGVESHSEGMEVVVAEAEPDHHHHHPHHLVSDH